MSHLESNTCYKTARVGVELLVLVNTNDKNFIKPL